MSVIEQIQEHGQARKRKTVEAEGWGEGGGTLTIWVSPWNVGERGKLAKYAEKYGTASIVDVIIMKAETEDGKKMFSIEDKAVFKHEADDDLVADVSTRIMTAWDEDALAKK